MSLFNRINWSGPRRIRLSPNIISSTYLSIEFTIKKRNTSSSQTADITLDHSCLTKILKFSSIIPVSKQISLPQIIICSKSPLLKIVMKNLLRIIIMTRGSFKYSIRLEQSLSMLSLMDTTLNSLVNLATHSLKLKHWT